MQLIQNYNLCDRLENINVICPFNACCSVF